MAAPNYENWPGNSAHCLDHRFSCGFVYNCPEETRVAKEHEGLLAQWILQGRGELLADGIRYPISSGMLCLRRPQDTYTLRLTGRVQHARCFLLLPNSAYETLCDFYPMLRTTPPISNLPYDQKLIDRLWDMMRQMREGGDNAACRLLGEALDVLLSMAKPIAPLSEGDSLLAACRVLRDPDEFELPLPELAEKLGMPYHVFRKRFTAQYEVSPGKYRLLRRMEYARHALATGDRIQTVATRLGFSDIHAFSKQFRAMTGETPGQFRARTLL